jgi:phospholipid transport system substrate-binding protein
MDKVEGYSGEKVVYEGDSVDKDFGVVKVKILTTTNKEIPVEYRLRNKSGTWLVYDLSVEGISLINNYRSQFNSILVKSPFKDLLERLRAKSLQ